MVATISSNNLGAQEFAPGKSRTAPPAVATASAAGDIDDTSSRSNILSDKRMMAAKERFYEELDAKDSKKKIKTRTIPSEYATSPSLSAAETAANLASSDAAVGAARDDATPTTTTFGDIGRSRHPTSQGNIERVNDQYRNALQAWMKMNNKKLWA